MDKPEGSTDSRKSAEALASPATDARVRDALASRYFIKLNEIDPEAAKEFALKAEAAIRSNLRIEIPPLVASRKTEATETLPTSRKSNVVDTARKWLCFSGWFLIWFLIFSFAVVPMLSTVKGAGIGAVFCYWGANGLLLIYGFIFVNKRFVAVNETGSLLRSFSEFESMDDHDKFFILFTVVLLLVALAKFAILLSGEQEPNSQVNVYAPGYKGPGSAQVPTEFVNPYAPGYKGPGSAQVPTEFVNVFAPDYKEPAVQARFFGPANYWECILELMPGTQNDIVAGNLASQCSKKFPDARALSAKEKVGGLISVPTKDDCLVKHGKNTPSLLAAKMIYGACAQLYW